MKCAAELIAMKNEAIAKFNALVNAKYEEMVANAINLCETQINSTFEAKAKARSTLKEIYWIGIYKDELEHNFFRFGSRSAHNNSNLPAYALEPFIDYLHKFCYEVNISDVDKEGDIKLTIYIPKEDKNRECGI